MSAELAISKGTRTTCPYCGVGCGVVVSSDNRVAGDPEHPANAGRLCSKGSALGETLTAPGRLLYPQIGGRKTEWDKALDLVAQRFQTTIADYGPDAVAFYVSGQLLTEDYYVANKLAKGFLGTANIDTNSRLCMASSVAGHRRAFGEDLVPGAYADFDEADLVILVGSNTAWCHPILFQRLQAARERRGTRIVVIDPRRTATATGADLHLAARGGTDVLLFNGLLAYLAAAKAIDPVHIAQRTTGFDAALAAARDDAMDIASVAARCGVGVAELECFYQWFAATERVVTAYSQGVNQSTAGTDKVNAIINCHFATNRIGRPGMGPFSLTGQPNAMGGREVGGLANQLAAHMSFDDPAAIDRVQRFWQAPHMARHAGLTAVEMFDAVAEGRIKALWIMGTNPAVSMPNADKVREALKGCPFVVVSDCVAHTDTTQYAHVLLPALTWGEKNGTVTNSERRISRQRPFLPTPGEARPDWAIVTGVAQRLGFASDFAYATPAEIFREHAALSAFENEGGRFFDIGALATLDESAYDDLQPIQWPCPKGSPEGKTRLLDDGICPTKDGRGRFIATGYRPPQFEANDNHPLILNTGRLRDQWHTMTRTGHVPRLTAHMPEPYVDVHPADAARRALRDGDLIRLSSAWGKAVARARIVAEQPQGSVFLPMHWNEQFADDCVVGRLANPAIDAVSHQPELKYTPVKIERIETKFELRLMTSREFKPQGLGHWSRQKAEGCDIYRMFGSDVADDVIERAEALLAGDIAAADLEVIEYRDPARGVVRIAQIDGQGLREILFMGPAGSLPATEAVVGLFAEQKPLDAACRASVLSGRIARDAPPAGRIVCVCYQVGLETIRAACREGIRDVQTLGKHLRAGTNCGSCLPELKEILAEVHVAAAE